MSHTSVALQELTSGRLQQDIADQIGMPRTTFTQYRLGARPPTVEVVEQMLRAFDDQEQRVLVKAYLDDETPASWFGRVKIDFKNEPKKKSSKSGGKNPEPGAAQSAAFAAAILETSAAGELVSDDKMLSEAFVTLLARARENKDVRQVILDLAAIV